MLIINTNPNRSMRRVLLVAGLPLALGIAVGFIANPAYFSTAQVDSVLKSFRVLDPEVTYDDIIPATNYTARKYFDVGLQRPPVAVANKCLFYFSHVRNQTAWNYGIYVADWLEKRGERSEDYIAFPYTFAWSPYNLSAGWKSALAQAHVSECFVEAYERTKDDRYLTLAKQSLLFLRVPVSEGGVLIDEGNNRWWYEEYPSEGGSYVLNGNQFTLLALSKYLEIDDDPEIRELFENGLRALKVDAFLYDNGVNDSFYDRKGGPAVQYHETHIINFQRLYDITGDRDWLVIKQVFEE
jgi:hypothetical protein